ncbi:hypothetical protein Q0812_04650 [Brevundimonas sp. 2R-24]|uniref:DUF2975 domain-containing protein n=1 Tax=Peiella sedimenti TaxID=3061083 RepID=A0ABT8SM50_9CAUL|nr:hypothetical protein [Caulobacteraceae bacterium XZ-24]
MPATRHYKGRIPWSWLALAIAAVQAGSCLLLGLVMVLAVREGSGSDLIFRLNSIAYWVAGIIQGAVLGVVVLATARALSNRTRRPGRTFVLVSALLPAGLLLALKGWVLIAMGDVFGSPGLWLELLVVALSFGAGAFTYLAAARTAGVDVMDLRD